MRKNFCVRDLDETLIDRFKEYVRRKYGGKLYGVLRVEIENALRTYLEEEGHYDMHTHTHEPKAYRPKESKEVGPKNETGKRNLMYASYGDSGDNDGESGVKKLPNSNEPGIPPSERTKRRIIQHLKRLGMLDVERINENAVKRVIGVEAGYDSRTINKYFNILEDEYLLPHMEYVNKRDLRKL